MNINGNLTSVLSIWIGAGWFTGGKERISAIVEKQIEPSRIAVIRIDGSTILVPTATAITIGIMEITIPVKADASMSPKRIVQTATGVETSLSKVLAWLSQGKTTGDMAEQVKNTETAISPGISDAIDTPRPKAKEMNMKPGQSTPIRTTGPLE
jgi:hypothetical protein